MALPLAIGAVTVIGTTFASRGQPLARPLDAFGIALLLAGPAALGVRRIQPVAALGLAAAALAVYLAVGYPFGPVFLAPVLALCAAVTVGHRLAAYTITGIAFATVLLGQGDQSFGRDTFFRRRPCGATALRRTTTSLRTTASLKGASLSRHHSSETSYGRTKQTNGLPTSPLA